MGFLSLGDSRSQVGNSHGPGCGKGLHSTERHSCLSDGGVIDERTS